MTFSTSSAFHPLSCSRRVTCGNDATATGYRCSRLLPNRATTSPVTLGSIDLCVQEHQLLGVRALAQACPDAVIVLEHLGKPRLELAPSGPWRDGMPPLAAVPNVVCKISPTVFTGEEPRLGFELAARCVEHAIGSFGWDRIIFGSNWPVSTAIVGYAEWVEMLDRITNGAAEHERRRFFAENARRIYSLPAV